jgi:hypothetical protein
LLRFVNMFGRHTGGVGRMPSRAAVWMDLVHAILVPSRPFALRCGLGLQMVVAAGVTLS